MISLIEGFSSACLCGGREYRCILFIAKINCVGATVAATRSSVMARIDRVRTYSTTSGRALLKSILAIYNLAIGNGGDPANTRRHPTNHAGQQCGKRA